MEIVKNDIIAYYPRNRAEGIVAYFSGIYSHVAVAKDNFTEVSSVWRKGVSRFRINKFREYDIFRLKPDYRFDSDKAWEWVQEMINKQVKYDVMGLVAYLFRKPFLNNPNKFFCSEFVDQFFLAGNIEIRADLECWQTGPTDVANSDLLYKVGRGDGYHVSV